MRNYDDLAHQELEEIYEALQRLESSTRIF